MYQIPVSVRRDKYKHHWIFKYAAEYCDFRCGNLFGLANLTCAEQSRRKVCYEGMTGVFVFLRNTIFVSKRKTQIKEFL